MPRSAQPEGPVEWEAVDLTTGEVLPLRGLHDDYLAAAMQVSFDRPEFFDTDPQKRVIRQKESPKCRTPRK